jgi:hypothetical protein
MPPKIKSSLLAGIIVPIKINQAIIRKVKYDKSNLIELKQNVKGLY